MKKTIINVLLLLMLSMALIVSCSQNAGENAAVGEELVDISFSTMTSRALTATREAFDEKEYVWKYEAVKDDATGLTHGQTKEAKYVVSSTTAGLKGHKITDLSQGYWNFTLYAYKAVKEGGTVTGHSDVYSFKGTVTHQKVVKGNLTVVDVTVSPNTEGYGSISFSNTILLDTLDGGHISALAEQLRMGFGVSAYETPSTPIDSSQWTNLKAGTYIVTVQVYDKDDPGMVYAIESKIVTVYTGLNTEIRGSVGELSAGIQFGNVTAEIIEATTPVIDKNTKGDTSGNVAFQSSGTIPVTASLPATTAVALLGTVTEGTTKEMTLTLEIQSEEATVSEQQTSKVYDISLMQTTVTKDSTGEVTSDVGIIKNLSTAEDKLAKYYLTATLTIDAGLDNVSVTHSTLPMIPFTGDAPDYTQDEQGTVGSEQIWKGFYKYDKSSGVLTIITRSFSPFQVFYTEPTVVTYPVAVYDSSGNLVSGYSTVQAAVDAAAAGQTVKLLADINLAAQVVVEKKLTLDLNGQKIYNTSDIWDNADAWSLISVQREGALTITGNGTLDAKKDDCYAVDVRDVDASLVVENGTINGNVHAIYAYEGFVTVKGGSFNIKQVYPYDNKPYEFELNCYDKSYNAGIANFTVTGGTFYKFNPGDNQSETGGHTDYLADGYMAIKNSDSTYTVVKIPEGVVAYIKADTLEWYSTLESAIDDAQPEDTIELLCDVFCEKGLGEISDITIDGNGYKVSFGNDVVPFYSVNNCTLKELDVYMNNPNEDFVLVYYITDSLFDNVDIYGQGNVTGNVGAFAYRTMGTNTFNNCDVYATMNGGGHASNYNSAFFGVPAGTVNMNDCSFNGVLKCGSAAMLVANSCYTGVVLNLHNVKNNGLIQTTCSTNNTYFAIPNTIFAVTYDGTHTSTKINVDGEPVKLSVAVSMEYDELKGTGNFLVGPDDPTLNIALNEDKTFTITPATASNVAYYEIAIGTYVAVPGGSNRNYIFEKINADGVLKSTIKWADFVDYAWVELNEQAVEGELHGHTTYTLNGTMYYLVEDPTYSTGSSIRELCICSVSAFEEDGTLIASVSYPFN